MAYYVNMHEECDSHTNRPTAAVHHELISFADVELQMMAVEPCDEGLYQSSVRLGKNSL